MNRIKEYIDICNELISLNLDKKTFKENYHHIKKLDPNYYLLDESGKDFIPWETNPILFKKILNLYFDTLTSILEIPEYNWAKFEKDEFHKYILENFFAIMCLRRLDKKGKLPTSDYFLPFLKTCFDRYNKKIWTYE